MSYDQAAFLLNALLNVGNQHPDVLTVAKQEPPVEQSSSQQTFTTIEQGSSHQQQQQQWPLVVTTPYQWLPSAVMPGYSGYSQAPQSIPFLTPPIEQM